MNTDEHYYSSEPFDSYPAVSVQRHGEKAAHAKGRWHSICFQLRFIYGTWRVNLIIIIIPVLQCSSFVHGKHLSNNSCNNKMAHFRLE